VEALAVHCDRDVARDRAAARLDAFDRVRRADDLRDVQRPHVVQPLVREAALDDHAALLDVLHDRARVAALRDGVGRALVQRHVLPRLALDELEQHVVRVFTLFAFF